MKLIIIHAAPRADKMEITSMTTDKISSPVIELGADSAGMVAARCSQRSQEMFEMLLIIFSFTTCTRESQLNYK